MNIFKVDGNFISLNTDYCEFYIPINYFDPTVKLATEMDKKIKVFGLFKIGIFEKGKFKEMRIFNLPMGIDLYTYETDISEINLVDNNGDKTQCRVLKYTKGSKIMDYGYFPDDEYVKQFLNMLLDGNIPSSIPYSKLLSVWNKNTEICGVNFGLNSFYMELVLSTVYRNPNDLSQKFSKIASDKGVSDYDYKTASIRQICQYNSTFTAVTFEDIDSMITTSLNKTRTKGNEKFSPLEEIIKY